MTLSLTVLRCPDHVTPQTRIVQGGEFSLGRGTDNDWVLPDPGRELSKRHCVLAFRSGGWVVLDQSTNGTFVNWDTDPVGRDRPRPLNDGDRIRLGPYEIEVRVEAEQAPLTEPFGGAASSLDPFVGDARIGEAPVSAMPFGIDQAPPHGDPFAGLVQPDHTPAVGDAYRPPAVQSPLLPEDWDSDITPSPSPPPSPPSPPPPVAVPAAAPRPPAATAAPSRESSDLLEAFLAGTGMPDARPTDPAAAMHELGAAFRALVEGLRQALIARASIKEEFRVTQTQIRTRGNNPLKFSAGDDDALTALLGAGRKTDMGPAEAVRDAMRDIRRHELATTVAMQSAVRAVMAQLSPEKIRGEAGGGGVALVPPLRKARWWDTFEALHARTTAALTDDFDSVFGRAFARAYEQALADLAQREDRS